MGINMNYTQGKYKLLQEVLRVVFTKPSAKKN